MSNNRDTVFLCLLAFVLYAGTALYAADGPRALTAEDADYSNFLIRVILIGNPQVIVISVALAMMIKGSFWTPYGYSEDTFPLVVGCIGGLLSWGSFLDVNKIVGVDPVPVTGPLFAWNIFVHTAGSWALWEAIRIGRQLLRRMIGHQAEQRKEHGTP